MTRRIKRALKRYDTQITALVRKHTIKQLNKHEIDYSITNDVIVSNRNKDVERIYNSVMMQVISDFQMVNGDYNRLKNLYE